MIKAAVANTEFETKEEDKTKGRKKKAKTVDTKLEVRKVTNKVGELKNIPMYGARMKGNFKSLLVHQRLRQLKFNINYDDDCWKPFTMCGFHSAEHINTQLGNYDYYFVQHSDLLQGATG